MSAFDDLRAVGAFAFKNWAPIYGLIEGAKKAIAAINEVDPTIIPKMRDDVVALMRALDPTAVAVATKVLTDKPLTDDERRWMDRASQQGST